MTERYAFKPRPAGHLADEALDSDGPVFDYVAELHELLWRVTRAVRPGAGGRLTEEFPKALEQLEQLEPSTGVREALEEAEWCIRRDSARLGYEPVALKKVRAALAALEKAPANPDCAVCGHRDKYHGAGSCHRCACEGRFATAEDRA